MLRSRSRGQATGTKESTRTSTPESSCRFDSPNHSSAKRDPYTTTSMLHHNTDLHSQFLLPPGDVIPLSLVATVKYERQARFLSHLIYPVVWLTVGAPLEILQPASSTPRGSRQILCRHDSLPTNCLPAAADSESGNRFSPTRLVGPSQGSVSSPRPAKPKIYTKKKKKKKPRRCSVSSKKE